MNRPWRALDTGDFRRVLLAAGVYIEKRFRRAGNTIPAQQYALSRLRRDKRTYGPVVNRAFLARAQQGTVIPGR